MTRKPRHLDQWVLVVLGIVVAGVLLVAPLVLIFVEALSGGWSLLVINLQRDYMRSAILLTLVAAGLSVPVNVVFGILLAWCVTRFRFRGRTLLANLVNIPYAMSPVVAGLCYVVVYGLESATGRWLDAHGVRVVFAWPGIVLVTIFVTSPYVARALIPLMESKGPDEEEAALTLGARGWDTFRRVTLPNIKWGLVYGGGVDQCPSRGRVRCRGRGVRGDHESNTDVAAAGGAVEQRLQDRCRVYRRRDARIDSSDHADAQDAPRMASATTRRNGAGRGGRPSHATVTSHRCWGTPALRWKSRGIRYFGETRASSSTQRFIFSASSVSTSVARARSVRIAPCAHQARSALARARRALPAVHRARVAP
jgi:sulfate transport system permease protein